MNVQFDRGQADTELSSNLDTTMADQSSATLSTYAGFTR